jgi:hypothetical protein
LLAGLVVCALLLSGSAADARSGGGARGGESFGGHERTTSVDTAGSGLTSGTSSSLSPVSPLPSREPLYRMASPSLNEGQIGAAPNLGPVTGYGPGGMSHIPGSPANPPY